MASLPVRRISSNGFQRNAAANPNEKGPDLLCRVKYSNILPDLPFEGKFLPCPFVSLDRFVNYKSSSLEREYKYELLCEADLGVDIDLIDPLTYKIDSIKPEMSEADAELLEEDTSKGYKKGAINAKRSEQHRKVVPWMRKTEYISSEFNRFGVSADRQETKVGYKMRKELENEAQYNSIESQIEKIQKTFEDAKIPVREHYAKKKVHAVKEEPILPDFQWWKYAFAQVVFDSDPSLVGVKEEDKKKLLENAQIRGMQDDDGTQFVGYFTPTLETVERRIEEKKNGTVDPEHEYEYVMNREYNWNVRNRATKGFENENYMITFREGCVFYNEIETRVKLLRRRTNTSKNSRLHLKLIPPSETEQAQMDARIQSLIRPIREEEEEEPKDDGDENDGNSDENGGSPKEEKEGSEDEEEKASEKSEKTSSSSDSD